MAADTNWLRQSPDKPLFPDILWSRPENKRFAGKLLIVGGSSHGFAAPGEAFSAAEKAGIGSVRVLLPDSTKRALAKLLPEADFAPSTQSGSFSRQALDQLMEHAPWADGVLLAGDFGKNSETAILLESFLKKYQGQLNLAGDSIDYFLSSDSPLLSRNNIVITAELGQLQKLANSNRPSTPVLHKMNLHELVTVLGDWSNGSPTAFITHHADSFVVAAGGKVSTTPTKSSKNWQTNLAAYATVWSLQQVDKVFETIVSAVYDYRIK
jgi:ADP-dependent NAD(P)H-hydrate dehydratase / NAD(P)H-hydrate epimerase